MKNTPYSVYCTLTLILLFSLLLTKGNSQGNSNRDYWKKITERELNMEVRHQKKLDKLKENKLFKSIDPIKFEDITSFIIQGKLQFKNPKNTEILVAVPTSVEATSNNEFSWNGKFEDGRGHITLIAHNGDIFGRFDIDDEVYEIQDLGGKKNVLLKFDKNKEFICGDHQVTQNQPEPQRPSDIIQNRVSPLTCDNNVRILVLYTPLVGQYQNPYNIATIGVNDLNISIRNSGISASDLSFTLAGVDLLSGFTENPDIYITFDNFIAMDITIVR